MKRLGEVTVGTTGAEVDSVDVKVSSDWTLLDCWIATRWSTRLTGPVFTEGGALAFLGARAFLILMA